MLKKLKGVHAIFGASLLHLQAFKKNYQRTHKPAGYTIRTQINVTLKDRLPRVMRTHEQAVKWKKMGTERTRTDESISADEGPLDRNIQFRTMCYVGIPTPDSRYW